MSELIMLYLVNRYEFDKNYADGKIKRERLTVTGLGDNLFMKFKLKSTKKQLHFCFILLFILIIFIFCFQEIQIFKGLIVVAQVFLSIVGSIMMFLFTQEKDEIVQLDQVKPVWKILKFNSTIYWVTLSGGSGILDSIRYYSIILNKDDEIKSVNMLSNYGKKLHKNHLKRIDNEAVVPNALPDFYFSPNAVVCNKGQFQLQDSPLFEKEDDTSAEEVFINSDAGKQEDYLFIIKATTIHNDQTFYFVNKNVNGGISIVNGTPEPYTGGIPVQKAMKYLKMLQKSVGNVYTPKKENKMIASIRSNLSEINWLSVFIRIFFTFLSNLIIWFCFFYFC
ncbi:hypothetical protein FXE12_11945 [Lactobacillus sp. SL9-6]|nr:hypothetical protein FXE12_11945 [Lactobacillus sp. SL9-6]